MFMLQTLKEFVDNPMGKGSNAIPSRQLIRDDLNSRFDKMLQDKEKKIEYTVYRDGDEYFFHFLIPSEGPGKRNNYDVVLNFILDENVKEAKYDTTLARYVVRFFSNSPSFTYTYAFAFDLHGMLITELRKEFDTQVLTDPPVTRNPAEVINYEKSIYFACRYLTLHSEYLQRIRIHGMAKPFKLKEFQQLIRNTDVIELEIKQEDNRLKNEKEKHDRSEKRLKDKEQAQSKSEKDKGKSTPMAKSGGNINRISPKGKVTAKSSKAKIKPR